ncbi:MAG: ribonuclease III [Gallionellales bacterium RIFCSPLOWO2_12_FULL_59_22]|nr:MAG: ribonuclease III [Gallionellales bacterium RIFCSPLOWO2_02_FULL_59_110]OGT05073.1 MAG: ribonuclease III [Gallionellales bacterium RIFCSPLOWO2_02_58_13]OGT12704.1 MAG: ribonuclease III [Gallionellales bacterium RIFCSPLOWO2_12_FULL_59_22]
MTNKQSSALCRQLGHVFVQPQLLQRALTHRSHAPEHNERLEFLGDSVLGCVIAKYLYDNYPQLSEGELSRLRSNLVREDTLAVLAQQLDLGSQLKLGEGERKSGGFRRPSILADAMEALFGAVLLDGGFAAAEKTVLGLYVPYLAQVDAQTLGKDAKTLLQEYLQGKRIPLPNYSVVATQGQAHEQSFEVECAIPSLKISTRGKGSSRRNAEQQAAQTAYQIIQPTAVR